MLFCGITGSVYRIGFFDLLFTFDSERYNGYAKKLYELVVSKSSNNRSKVMGMGSEN